MDFSDDEDFFCRAGEEEEEDLMGFGGGMSFQPYDEEVEMFPAEMLGVPEEVGPPEGETVEPQAKRAKAEEENEPEPGPEPGTGAGPSTDNCCP